MSLIDKYIVNRLLSIIKILGWLLRQGPPLPIPNREVKPASADDTAIPSGKVGRRQLFKKPQHIVLRLFLVYTRIYNRIILIGIG